MTKEIDFSRIGRLQKRFPGKILEEYVAMDEFLQRYMEIALQIYLEATRDQDEE